MKLQIGDNVSINTDYFNLKKLCSKMIGHSQLKDPTKCGYKFLFGGFLPLEVSNYANRCQTSYFKDDKNIPMNIMSIVKKGIFNVVIQTGISFDKRLWYIKIPKKIITGIRFHIKDRPVPGPTTLYPKDNTSNNFPKCEYLYESANDARDDFRDSVELESLISEILKKYVETINLLISYYVDISKLTDSSEYFLNLLEYRTAEAYRKNILQYIKDIGICVQQL